jgi:hypothetical protein
MTRTLAMTRTLSIAAALFVGCATNALAQNAGEPLSSEMAQRRLEAYVHTWSTNAGVNAATVANYYAERGVYYGKPMSRSDILRDKLRYIAAWPERYYRIVPGTVSASCDHERTMCRVSGIMQWDRRSRGGARSVGSAKLSLTLSRASGGKIVHESASILRTAGAY